MKQKVFKEKYHIFEIEYDKKEIKYKNVNEILSALKNKIDENEVIAYIATFDQYAHTVKIKGDINPVIKDAKNIVFCFGKEIPTPEVLAVRPRSIGVVELEDKFIINFLEAPNEQANVAMTNMVKSLKQ